MGVPLPKVWEALLPIHSDEIRKYTDDYFFEKLSGEYKKRERCFIS